MQDIIVLQVRLANRKKYVGMLKVFAPHVMLRQLVWWKTRVDLVSVDVNFHTSHIGSDTLN